MVRYADTLSLPGQNRPKDGVASARLCPAIHRLRATLAEKMDARVSCSEDAFRAFARA